MQTESNNPFDDAPIISRYTRDDAIRDGSLVSVGGKISREAGFTCPVALTRAAWHDAVEWTDEDRRRKGGLPQDTEGRLWDVLHMARFAIKRARRSGTELIYQLYRVPRQGKGRKARLIALKLVCGPGDHGELVMTIMEPGED